MPRPNAVPRQTKAPAGRCCAFPQGLRQAVRPYFFISSVNCSSLSSVLFRALDCPSRPGMSRKDTVLPDIRKAPALAPIRRIGTSDALFCSVFRSDATALPRPHSLHPKTACHIRSDEAGPVFTSCSSSGFFCYQFRSQSRLTPPQSKRTKRQTRHCFQRSTSFDSSFRFLCSRKKQKMAMLNDRSG